MIFNKFKKFIKRLLNKNKLLSTYFEEGFILFKLKKAGKNIRDYNYRDLRVKALRHFLGRFLNLMVRLDYKQELLITPTGYYILSEGIILNAEITTQYFKLTNEQFFNQGSFMYRFLKAKGIEVNNMIDIGANWGEVSLYFSLKNPHAKILAVEASPDNFRILESNCRMQKFSTDNIILLNEAVSDRNGFLEITRGISAENKIVNDYRNEKTVTVKCDTLSSLIKRFNFEAVDFLKIDIEGAEPLLLDSIKENISRFKAIIIEVSNRTDVKDYLPLLNFLWQRKMVCFLDPRDTPISSFDEIEKIIMTDGFDASDFWFIKS